MSKKQPKYIDLETLPIKQRTEIANALGAEILSNLEKAKDRLNKRLSKYGYFLEVTAELHDLKKKKAQE